MSVKEAKDALVLVVDDDVMLRKVLTMDFARRGYRVFSAGNGTEAFELVSTHKFDLVLTDVKMADGDGIELLSRIRGLGGITPIVMFMSGFTDMSVEEAFDLGADAMFPKPFDRKALFDAIEKAVTASDDRWKNRPIRVQVDLGVELQFPGLGTAVQTKVVNIGRRGMFVLITEPPPTVGGPISFKIKLPQFSREMIEGSGVFRWVRPAALEHLPAGCGVEFLDMDDRVKKQLAELINAVVTKASFF